VTGTQEAAKKCTDIDFDWRATNVLNPVFLEVAASAIIHQAFIGLGSLSKHHRHALQLCLQ
jgi:hypothetical protein